MSTVPNDKVTFSTAPNTAEYAYIDRTSQDPHFNFGPTESEQREIEARWLATMARIGVAPTASELGPGRTVITPTGSGRVAFDILDIINGICDVADRVGRAAEGTGR